jgi:hypothetical protein
VNGHDEQLAAQEASPRDQVLEAPTAGLRRALNAAFTLCLECPRVPTRGQPAVPVSYPQAVVCFSNHTTPSPG